MIQNARPPAPAGRKMMHPDDSEITFPSDHDTALGKAEDITSKSDPPLPPQPAHSDWGVAPSSPLPAQTGNANANGCKGYGSEESGGSHSPQGRGGAGPAPAVSSRSAKRGPRSQASRLQRGHRAKAKVKYPHGSGAQSHEAVVRASGGRNGVPNEAHKEQQESREAVFSAPSLEARKSTYFSICLNASPDELTVVSYNVGMEGSCCSFDDNWRRREAALSRYLLSLEDAHHPDVILVQGAYASSTLRLLKRFVREEPMFPFQTRVVGGDPGCCKAGNEEGGCSCCSCWCCLPLPARKAAKKGPAAAFITNNGWDSVYGSFSRFRGNGGIVVMSKWPILRRHAYIFSVSAYPQSLSNAGAALVQVEKCGKVYNVLAMQLQPGAKHNALRVAQVREVMAWVRTGMEDAEKVEFASCDIDGTFASTPDTSTGPQSSATDAADELGKTRKGGNENKQGGLPELEHGRTGAAKRYKGCPCRPGIAELPKGILKATDPLIIGGNLNFRFADDGAFLAKALGAEGFNATLALEDESVAQPSFDTVNNDTCYQSQGCPEQPTQELLDYLLLYSDHAGRVARGQRTLVDPSPEKIMFRPLVLGCMPCNTAEVSHVSAFFPVCATFAHTTGS